MRNHAIDQVTELAAKDNRVMIVTADLGYNVLNKFEDRFPDRFINVGIAEQNMTAVAAGLALSGNIVFTYSIGNFPTLRCIEQIRNDVCYHNANVKILSVGGGFAYGDLGMTHHATEDIAMMRALPYMRVYVPADSVEAVACIKEAYNTDGPAFVRMAKGGEMNLHEAGEQLDISKLSTFTEEPGRDINIITCGTALAEGIKLVHELEKDGYSVGVFSCPRVKPIDRTRIVELAYSSKLIVTMEEHNVIGGLGGAVAEILAEVPGQRSVLMRLGLQDTYSSIVGDQAYLRDYYGMSARKAYVRIKEYMEQCS